MRDVLAAQGLSRTFRAGGREVHAVRDAWFTVGEGELVVLLGRSGAGKTTLLSVAGGLDRPDAGSVVVSGQELTRLGRDQADRFRQAVVGWVFQTSGLLPLLTAAENVGLAMRLLGHPPEVADREARRALAAVGLEERADHRGLELSGGEQQRVALARALVKAPALLLADEPTAQLDTETGRSICLLLREAADSGTGVLFSTHDEAATEYADRVLRIEDGVLARA